MRRHFTIWGPSKRAALAVLFSAVVASFVISADRGSNPNGYSSAGSAAMAMLDEEHALAAGSAARMADAQREANVALAEEFARIRNEAAFATAEAPVTVAKVEIKAPSPKPHVAAPHETAVAEPLQLAAMMSPLPAATQQPGGSLVTRKARAVAAAVERVPSWLRQAADWVVDWPAPSLPRWRFASL
ncbi:MAG: hypothetical protein JO237_00985 [Pseudolabrys sp.]|nr:hypothetical protein [Pseudolabrys sp.]